MITGQIRNQIDQIWDAFFSMGITNSITVLEQMTYLFFMKMLDDAQLIKESNANLIGIQLPESEKTFTDGSWHNPDTGEDVPMQSLRWSNFIQQDPEALFRTVSRNAFSFIKNLGGTGASAYSRFMQNAIFLIPEPRKLLRIVEGVNALDMNNRDTMGDVYEYILGKMAASGTNGQFRTPRHIIRMMVEMMRPTLDDTVCDPAMGSAGFIVETAKYIQERHKAELHRSQNSRHFRNSMLHGFDTDQTMLRIGAMNLMLHGVDNPVVEYRDSLSEDNKDADKYTLILANPPFAGSLDYEVVSKSLLSVAKTKKTELLFVSLFKRMLQLGGRCASIVPDGVLTGSSKAHKAIRREVVDGQRLQAVISMPSGVFKPYAGVSTAILIFTRTDAGGTDNVWFYDMRADGYSLDDKRNEIADNDIPDIIARWGNLAAEADRKRTEQSFLVPLAEIQEHDYDLSFNTYRETVREKVEYEAPAVILSNIRELQTQFDGILTNLQNILAK
ncbi:HsdM family class I SAM-dependent methyltransferase [Muribaculum intestinale]|uniref:class I SAM-dependent DNA methyltransferase n=1 Tax=Muribaculum intestinale TaxID=1796646 RepID=UPI00261A55C9|nr:class I SAM-dependent DNA methyltransferase [Muribaculum intestinale]